MFLSPALASSVLVVPDALLWNMDGEEEYVVRSVPHYAGGSKNIRAHKGKGNLHGTAELGLTEVVWVLTLIMVVYALYRWLRLPQTAQAHR